MTPKRPRLITALAMTMWVGGLYFLVVTLLGLAGIWPVQVQTTIPGMSINLASTLGYLYMGLLSVLFLMAAYGLWTRRTWGNVLAALIIAIELFFQVGGASIFTFTVTANDWNARIDLGMLLAIVLLVTILDLLPKKSSLAMSGHEQQGT